MIHKANEGYEWQNKTTKMRMGDTIHIGFIFPNGVKTQDTIDNYEQVIKEEREERPRIIKGVEGD